jgi:hypothetical protein
MEPSFAHYLLLNYTYTIIEGNLQLFHPQMWNEPVEA